MHEREEDGRKRTRPPSAAPPSQHTALAHIFFASLFFSHSTHIFFSYTDEHDNEPEEDPDDHFDSVEPLTKSQLEARKISGSTYTLSPYSLPPHPAFEMNI